LKRPTFHHILVGQSEVARRDRGRAGRAAARPRRFATVPPPGRPRRRLLLG